MIPGDGAGFSASDLRYTAICVSVGERTAGCRGPPAPWDRTPTPRLLMPVRSSATTSSISHWPRPASRLDVSDGAYQSCSGMRPPDSSLSLTVAPSTLRLVWHASQWPSPSTRYAPRFHSADCPGIRLVLARLEVQRAPADQQVALVVGKLERVRLVLLLHRRDGLDVTVDRVRVRARDLRVARVRKRGIQERAVLRLAFVHRAVEIVRASTCRSPCLVVRRDVGRVQRAERRRHLEAARERLAAARRVACDAIAGAREVLAVGLRGHARRAGRPRGSSSPAQGGAQRTQPARRPTSDGDDAACAVC